MLEVGQRGKPEIGLGDPPNVHVAGPIVRNDLRYAQEKPGPVAAGYVSEDVFSGGKPRVKRADRNARAVRDICDAYVLELVVAQQGNRRLDKIVEHVLRSLLFGSGDDAWKPELRTDVIGARPWESVRPARHVVVMGGVARGCLSSDFA